MEFTPGTTLAIRLKAEQVRQLNKIAEKSKASGFDFVNKADILDVLLNLAETPAPPPEPLPPGMVTITETELAELRKKIADYEAYDAGTAEFDKEGLMAELADEKDENYRLTNSLDDAEKEIADLTARLNFTEAELTAMRVQMDGAVILKPDDARLRLFFAICEKRKEEPVNQVSILARMTQLPEINRLISPQDNFRRDLYVGL